MSMAMMGRYGFGRDLNGDRFPANTTNTANQKRDEPNPYGRLSAIPRLAPGINFVAYILIYSDIDLPIQYQDAAAIKVSAYSERSNWQSLQVHCSRRWSAPPLVMT